MLSNSPLSNLRRAFVISIPYPDARYVAVNSTTGNNQAADDAIASDEWPFANHLLEIHHLLQVSS